jgi:hypothetical protein
MLRNITRDLGLGLLAQDVDRWWDLVNAVMDLRGSIKFGKFLDYLRTC